MQARISLTGCMCMQDYAAKLSDFGLAKAGPQGDETHVSTRVMGTYGYAAPEYVMTDMAGSYMFKMLDLADVVVGT